MTCPNGQSNAVWHGPLQQRRTAAVSGAPLVAPGLLREPALTVGLDGIALFSAGSSAPGSC
nr:hypothetical protein [Streptomyces sp. CRN 30]